MVEDDISKVPNDPLSSLCPIKFLGSRQLQKGSSTLFQIQVQWDGALKNMFTWEEANDLYRCFPSSPSWGQAGIQGGGNVRRRCPGTVTSWAAATIRGDSGLVGWFGRLIGLLLLWAVGLVMVV